MPSLSEARRARRDIESTMSSTSRDEGVNEIETRNMALSAWPTGFGLADPAAIPPPGMHQMQRAGVPVTPHTSLQVDSVFNACRIITNAVIKLGNLRAYETELNNDNIPYRVWLRDQPAFLLESFGPGTFQYDGRRRTVMSLALFQEAFWHVIERDEDGYALSVDVLHPSFMKVKLEKDGTKVFKYGPPQDEVILPTDDVVHIPNMALPGGSRGLSGIEYGGVAFALALAAMEYGQKWFAQGASPSYILRTANKLNPTEVERIAQKFLFEHGGLANSHLPLILDQGMEAQKIQAHPDEAQYLQTLEYARTAIASWFGIPTFLQPNGLVRDTPEPPGVIQERMMSFLGYTLSGYTVPLEEAHSILIPTTAGFDTSRFTEPDAKAQAAWLMALRNSQIASVNDIRTRVLGWEPAPDADADKVMIPLASNVSGDPTDNAEASKDDQPVGDPGDSLT